MQIHTDEVAEEPPEDNTVMDMDVLKLDEEDVQDDVVVAAVVEVHRAQLEWVPKPLPSTVHYLHAY